MKSETSDREEVIFYIYKKKKSREENNLRSAKTTKVITRLKQFETVREFKIRQEKLRCFDCSLVDNRGTANVVLHCIECTMD